MEICEDIRQTLGMKDLYAQRKETIERIFGTAKENHGFRYTQMYGKARMEMKVGLTYACMNLKKLAKIKEKWELQEKRKSYKISILNAMHLIKEKWLWDLHPRAALSTVCACHLPGDRLFLVCKELHPVGSSVYHSLSNTNSPKPARQNIGTMTT